MSDSPASLNQKWQSVESSLGLRQDEQLSKPRLTQLIEPVLSKLRLPSEQLGFPHTPDTPHAYTSQEMAFAHLQRDNTLAALRRAVGLTGEIAEYRRAIPEILSAAKRATTTHEELACQHALSVVRDTLQNLRTEFAELARANPESFYVVYSRGFRRYTRQLNSGRIAITPFVADKIDEVLGILRATRMAIIHGPTGSGKSEIADIVAQRFSGKKPFVVSGHRDVSAREFRGYESLRRSGEIPSHEIAAHIERAKEHYRTNNPDATPAMLRSACRLIEERCIHENSVTISEFVLGYAYRAAKVGVPLIIDEFNLIDPTVIMGLNSLMTKKPGEIVYIPENGHPPFPVAAGFCVIMTGNLNTGQGVEYFRPHQPDASTINRFLPVTYGFPPQTTEGSPANAYPDDKQLYQIILCTLRSGRPSVGEADLPSRLEDRAILANLPGGVQSLDKLWRLAKLAAITQQALEGKVALDSPHAHRINGTAQAAKVEHALTPRVVVNLLEQWKNNGFEYELDHYVFKALVESALTAIEKDYFYRQLQLQGFCKSPGWPEVIDDGSERLHADIRSPKNREYSRPETVPGRVLISEIYGPPPERAEWPDQTTVSKISKRRGDAALRIKLLAAIDAELREVAVLLEATSWMETKSD